MAEPQQSTPRTPYTPEEPKANLASNILAIVGFIILIVVVIWGLVNLASLSRGWFASLFAGGEAVIEVTAPESATSGTPITISWEYDKPTSGTYAFLYQCASGLGFQTPGVVGMVGIPCGAAFTIGGEEKSISLTPYLSAREPLDVPLSILFMPSATGTQAQGSAAVRISPLSSVTPSPTPIPTGAPEPTPEPTPTPEPEPAPSPRLPADLSVRIISVSVDMSGNGIAIFDITNVGGTDSGTYYFSASLPTQTGYTYASPAQNPLAREAHIVSTLRFSQARGGVFSVSITTPDANASNNYASQTVTAPYGNYYDSYNYLPTGQAGNYPYNYGTMYPQYGYQYQTYPYTYQQPYQYPSYTQQYQYSTYYPYAY
ncbi:hypothetical protein HYW60_02900 [Candidatus Kaiserbacteria bacterium]|nr:hypothetical protein [Candidatus Kaiserbacteria bacterium]